MKYTELIAFGAMLIASAGASAETIVSPDGNLAVEVATTAAGVPVYSVTLNGATFLEESPLGLVTGTGNYTTGLSLCRASEQELFSDKYSLPNIKKNSVEVEARRQTFTFCTPDGKEAFQVEFHVADNNLAFRYHLLPQGEVKSTIVKNEATGFAMPEGTTTFLCPQSDAMVGFARTMPSYETNYTLDEPTGKNGWGHGYTFPCLFRNGDNGWMLISETGVDGSYCASHLAGNPDGLYTIAFPMEEEMNGVGSACPGVTLPSATPWRTIALGTTLAPIAESTIYFDVVGPKYEAAFTPAYGKGTWSWIMKGDSSCNFDEQKQYIDFARDLGYQTVLVDALWDTQIGRERVEELARYARDNGVALYLWYNSNGYWNDAPQGPRGLMDNSRIRRAEMKWMRDNGIRGIKVDFFGGDKQKMMQLYEDILADANDFGLMVIFHGCTLPRGWERMFPAYTASEAVLASENLNFSQDFNDKEAFNATLHPIIRNSVGSMDYGGSPLNRYWNSKNKPGRGNVRRTSDVFELAAAVLFQSPTQHFALAPNNLTDAPQWAIDFMKNVPTLWSDVKFLDGYPGRNVIMARKADGRWYVAGVNADTTTLRQKLALPMFAPGTELTVYSDDKDLQGSVKTVKVKKDGTIDIEIPCNGGVVLVGPEA